MTAMCIWGRVMWGINCCCEVFEWVRKKWTTHMNQEYGVGGRGLWRFSLIASVFLRELGSKVSCRVRVKKEIRDLRRKKKVNICTWDMYDCWAASRANTEVSDHEFKEWLALVVPFSSQIQPMGADIEWDLIMLDILPGSKVAKTGPK